MASSLFRVATSTLRLGHKIYGNSFLAAKELGYLSGPLRLHTNPPLHEANNVSHTVSGNGPSLAGFANYEEGIRDFKLEVPTYFNFSRDVIDKWAEVEKEELTSGVEEKGCMKHIGLWWTHETGREYKWTYSQLSDISKRIAFVLTGPCALEHGDRLMVMMDAYPQYWLLYLACSRAGIIMCPSSNYHSPDIIKQHLLNSQAKCIITDHTKVDKVEEIADACPDLKAKVFVPGSRAVHGILGWFNYADLYKTSNRMMSECFDSHSDDTMLIFFTSGTTGSAKLVQHSHASYGLAAVINGRYWYDQTRDDVTWIIADSGWAKLAWGILAAWHQGACLFVHCYSNPLAFSYDHFQPERILQTLEAYPITTLTTSPPMWRKLVQEDLASYTGHSLRQAFSGGELLNPEVIEKFKAGTGCSIYDGYGLTETSVVCANFKCLPQHEGSLGKPAPGYKVTIIDDDGKEVAVGHHGHIAIKTRPDQPPGLFVGYWNDPVLTSKCYIGDYYITGDIGYRDEDGYFWFLSRKEDIIHTDGKSVSPFDVENAMMEHPSVAECAAVCSPDHLQLVGQVVKAFIVLSDDYKNIDEDQILDDLRKHACSFLEPHEVPKEIEFVEGLPTGVSGKLKRSALRVKEWKLQKCNEA